MDAGFAPAIDPWQPYKDWNVPGGRGLDQGVLSNGLGGAFCPGGEVTWIIRNPAIWREPYRIKADPEWYTFALTAAQENANRWGAGVSEEGYIAYASDPLSLGSDFDIGLQPGDLTKLSGLPWQADFNECSTQTIDVTYEEWNVLYPDSVGNTLMERERRVWETLVVAGASADAGLLPRRPRPPVPQLGARHPADARRRPQNGDRMVEARLHGP